jgi:pyruvate,water dikinase
MNTIPTPATTSFPVDWESFDVEGIPFEFDRMHAPFPIPPLASSMPRAGFEAALLGGFQQLGIPARRSEHLFANHYNYSRMFMDPVTPEMAQAIESTMREAIAKQMDRWLGEYLPRTLELVEEIKAIDVSGMPLPAIPAAMDRARTLDEELWTIHFRVVFPMNLSMQLFGEFYADVFDAPEAEAHELMAGGVSESVRMSLALGDLAERARELGLGTLIVDTPDDALIAAIDAHPNGPAFRSEMDPFLDQYGYHQDLYLMTSPTWLERPELALAHLRQYLRGAFDARAHQEAVARRADDAAARARERLMGYPQPMREQFEALLAFGRQGAFLQEEHNFHIDQHSAALTRLFYLAVGRRLVEAGLIDAPDDIFMLEEPEVRSLLLDPAFASRGDDPRALVRERRREMAIAATLTPPPMLGDPGERPDAPDNPMTRGMRSFFGGPPREAGESGELLGNPASRGVATGRARIARSLEEAQGMRPGDVLVAVTTMPPWTPLFGVAAAVVTETGGALSHCAIVAREYGIPAVVGVHDATRLIPDGAMVTVDGAAGTVRIES